jgi:hypothetical protein
MSQRVKTSARGLVLPRSSSPENGHLRKKKCSTMTHLYVTFMNLLFYFNHDQFKTGLCKKVLSIFEEYTCMINFQKRLLNS